MLHGTFGLPDEAFRRAISLGVCKFNVNTELRQADLTSAAKYLSRTGKPELVDLMDTVIDAVKRPVISKIELFGSTGKAADYTHQPLVSSSPASALPSQ